MQIFANPNFNFIRWRWHAIILSAAVIGSGLFTIYARGGLPLGVDFSGGTVLQLKFNKPTPEDVIRNALGPLSSDAQVQTTGQPADNEILAQQAEAMYQFRDTLLRVYARLREPLTDIARRRLSHLDSEPA